MESNMKRQKVQLDQDDSKKRPAKLQKRRMTESKSDDNHIHFAPQDMERNSNHRDVPSEFHGPGGEKSVEDVPSAPHGPKGVKFVANKDVTFEDLAKRGVIPKSALNSRRWFSS